METSAPVRVHPADNSLMQLLKPEVMAQPYALYAKLRAFEPVHWDPFLHSWVVTSYAESMTALMKFKAARTPTAETMEAMGLPEMGPYAALMLKQLMFMDAPNHTRLRALCAVAFTPRRVEVLRERIQAVAEELLDGVEERGEMELIGEFAAPLPGYAIAAMLGIPAADASRLKRLTSSLGELIGNFNHEPEGIQASVKSMKELQAYVQEVIDRQRVGAGESEQEGLIAALLESEIEGTRLTDDEVIANVILILSGGLEETTNVIGTSVLNMLRHPAEMALLRAGLDEQPGTIGPAVEELLRFDSSTQHTGRIAPEDCVLGGKAIAKGDSVTIVIGAANRDPLRFVEPDRLDLRRTENKHLAFGYASHYCMGAPLTRLTTQIALTALLRRMPGLALAGEPVWRMNMGLHGLESLPLSFGRSDAQEQAGMPVYAEAF